MKIIPTPEEISSYYEKKSVGGNYSLSYTMSKDHSLDYDSVFKDFVEFTKINSAYPQEQKLLDIGCFIGLFLDRIKEHNFITYGVELQPEAAKIASNKHVGRIYSGNIENCTDLPSNFFDVVTLFGVIEHVTAPNEILQQTRIILKNNGTIIIQTPNTSSMQARVLRKWWPPYTPIEHIYYYSAKNMTTILENNQFAVDRVITHCKYLPIKYVHKQCEHFAPELYKILNKIMPLFPNTLSNCKIPFYGGEMLLAAKKLT